MNNCLISAGFYINVLINNVPVDEVSCFAMTYPKKRIIVAEKYMHFYDYDEPKD